MSIQYIKHIITDIKRVIYKYVVIIWNFNSPGTSIDIIRQKTNKEIAVLNENKNTNNNNNKLKFITSYPKKKFRLEIYLYLFIPMVKMDDRGKFTIFYLKWDGNFGGCRGKCHH